MPYIYKITNIVNNKCYIGKTVFSIEKRFKEHCRDCFKSTKEKRPLYAAMQKYGVENFQIEEIEQCDDKVLNEREKYWIEYFGSFKNGYNATLGGDGKSYIDYDLVVATYSQLQNEKEVAEKLKISRETVSSILKIRNVAVKSSSQILKEKLGKPVHMYDKNTNEYIQTFASMSEAGQFLIDNHYSNCKISTIRQHISEVCRGKRQTAAGFKWKTV